MRYTMHRENITDGMLIFVSGNTLVGRLIQFLTFGDWSHVGIAFWITDSHGNRRLMSCECWPGGSRIVNVGSFAAKRLAFVDVGIDWASVGDECLASTGAVDYGWVDLVAAYAKDVATKLNMKWFMKYLPNHKGMICSEFALNTMIKAGVVEACDPVVSPNKLFQICIPYMNYQPIYTEEV